MKSVPFLLVWVFFMMVISGCMHGTQNTGFTPSVTNTASDKSIEELYSRSEQPCYDEQNQSPCKAPSSFAGNINLVFDNSLIQATPHFFLLAAGKTEQEALLTYIQEADVSAQKKSEWSLFLMKMWMKYPVMYRKNGASARLIPGKTAYPYSLTPEENAMFQEIEQYIAEDMGKTRQKQDKGK